MLVSRSRDKLINAILYFAERTRGLGKIKLFKLLYLLDFEHFRQTGSPVTGMEYRAWKMSPAPAALVQIWDDLDADLAVRYADDLSEKMIDITHTENGPWASVWQDGARSDHTALLLPRTTRTTRTCNGIFLLRFE
jgi:uncharacterized phage-associated protein